MARYIDADKLLEEVKRGGHALQEWSTLGVCGVIERQPIADVIPKSEEGAECPTCYGTGRIGTTNWLTKNISKKQLAEEKAQAIAEHEQYIKTEYAREIFEEIEKHMVVFGDTSLSTYFRGIGWKVFAELKKKYTEEQK